ALALRKLRGCEVDIAVFTNLSPEHLDFHGTLQRYLETKGQLFVMLPGSADKGVAKTAVLNADDPHWRYLADRAEGARVMTYGIDAHADVQGTVLSADAAGSKVRIATEGGSIELMLPLVGRFNVHNALAAAAAGAGGGRGEVRRPLRDHSGGSSPRGAGEDPRGDRGGRDRGGEAAGQRLSGDRGSS